MKWKAKDCLLALFLCLVFVLVVGYGAFSFGGDDMEKCWIGQIVLIVFFTIFLFGGVYIIHEICTYCPSGSCSSATFSLQIRDACGCGRCERFKESEVYPNEGFENAKKILIVGEKLAKNFLAKDFENLKKSDVDLYFVPGENYQEIFDEVKQMATVKKPYYGDGFLHLKVHKD